MYGERGTYLQIESNAWTVICLLAWYARNKTWHVRGTSHDYDKEIPLINTVLPETII